MHTDRTASSLISRPVARWVLATLGAAALLFNAGCSVLGKSSVEEADYRVLLQDDKFELREYAPLLVAETRVEASFKEAGNIAFRRLFGYISGDNASEQTIAMTAPVIADADQGEKIQMTAPVIAEEDGSSWRYRFVLPASYTMDSAPTPLNEDVTIVAVPQKIVAVLRFSGLVSQADVDEKSEELERWMMGNKLEAASAARWAGYNPPWTLPFLRRNEVMVDAAQ